MTLRMTTRSGRTATFSATLIAFGLAGCATAPPTEAPADAAARGAADVSVKQVITFIDLDAFDTQMQRALAGKASEVVIEFAAPMSPNAIAPRLGRWLNTLQEQGGKVQVVGEARTRSLSILAALAQAVYEGWREMRMRALVTGMDAEMTVQGGSIQSIVFKRRA